MIESEKAVLLSVQPKWCELIASGKKTIEVRKTKPKLPTPFKCYIYCTKKQLLTKSHYNGTIYVATHKSLQKALEHNGNVTLSGKVIGEFVCDKIYEHNWADYRLDYGTDEHYHSKLCLSYADLNKYGNRKNIYGWRISDLVIYDKPKELNEFHKPCDCLEEYEGEVYHDCLNCDYGEDSDYGVIACRRTITRPPQSWCYVERLVNE